MSDTADAPIPIPTELPIDLDVVREDPTLAYALETFLRYASHRIQEQAIPHFMDGLLPGQRKLLLSMQDLGALWDRKYQKSSRIVAQSTATYHPVGNTYGVLVNMSQAFRVPVLLTDPEGSWGEPENGVAAAERYTEIRYSRFGQEILLSNLPGRRYTSDQTPHTIVPTSLTYTDLHWEEAYFPARLPLLLLNGSNGIAIGIAQTFQPIAYTCLLDLLDHFVRTGSLPDMPLKLGYPANCAILSTPAEVSAAFRTGRGSIRTAARYEYITERNRLKAIAFTAVPPGVYLNPIGDAFYEWKRNDPLCPFAEYKNESEEGKGVRIIFEFKPSARPTTEVERTTALTALYRNLPLTVSQTVNMVALKGRFPVFYTLATFLTDWIEERSAIIQRVAQAELDRLNREIHRLDVLIWVRENLKTVTVTLEDAPTADAIHDTLTPYWRLRFVRDFTPDDLEILLAINLRQVSRLNTEELMARVGRTRAQLAAQQRLVDDSEARKEAILADIAFFRTQQDRYGIRDADCPYDSELAALLSRPITTAKLAADKGEIDTAKLTYEHPLVPFLLRSDELDVIVQTTKGVVTRIANKSVRTAPLSVKVLGEDDRLVRASFLQTEYLIGLTVEGKLFPYPKDKLPIGKPVYPAALAQMARLKDLDGWMLVPALADKPTHVWATFSDNTVKRIPLTDFATLRSAITLPSAPTFVALVGNEPFTVLTYENNLTTVDPTKYTPTSVKRIGHLPKKRLGDIFGMPARVENKMVIVVNPEQATIAKRFL